MATDRLELRCFQRGDLGALGHLQRSPDVARYLYWDPPDDEELVSRLERRLGDTILATDGDRLSWAVTKRGHSALIADVTMILTSVEHRQLEIGYVVHPDHQGRGYATETARSLVDFGFGVVGAHRIVGRIDARNHASAAVLERAGMRQEAHLRENELVKGVWTDEAIYAVLLDEWRAPTR
jgi:RimJ/RimL family protein N-acetyltransferase